MMSRTLNVPAPQSRSSGTPLPSYAIGWVGAIAAVAAVALVLSLGRYGFFGDELYFVAAGRHLSVSYADQGPLVPAVARLADLVAPGSMAVLRIPAAVVTVGALLLSAQIAREFGGGRGAQVLTAAAYGTSVFLLVQGTQLATNTFDTALWVLIGWLLIRWVRTRRDGLLLCAGVATAAAMQVKWLIPFFWIAVVIAVLVCGPRDLLRRPALWAAGALVGVSMVPGLLWQAARGWPQLRMAARIAAEEDTIGGRYSLVPLAVAAAGGLGALLLAVGMWALLRWEPLRPYRFLGPVLPLLLVAFLVTDGRPYYVCGVYAPITAAGAVWWTGRALRWRQVLALGLALASLVSVLGALPWRPESRIEPAAGPREAGLAITVYGKFGWPELRAAVAGAYDALPEPERDRAVVIADSYWQASALAVAPPEYRLPVVYSPDRGYGYFGTPPDSATTVLWVGGDRARLAGRFGTVTPVGRFDTRLGYPDITRDVTIWRCDEPRRPWSQAWPALRSLD
jgi:hypothetical protein